MQTEGKEHGPEKISQSNRINYGFTKKINSNGEESYGWPRHHDEDRDQVSRADRDGHQGKTFQNCPHQPYRPFKDSRKWRTQAKEQAR